MAALDVMSDGEVDEEEGPAVTVRPARDFSTQLLLWKQLRALVRGREMRYSEFDACT